MPLLNYAIAAPLLNDNDKSRIICLYFSTADTNTGIDWKKATADHRAASVESFKKTIQNMHKRIESAGGKKLEPAGHPETAAAKRRKRKVSEEPMSGSAFGKVKKRGAVKHEQEQVAVKTEDRLGEKEENVVPKSESSDEPVF